ncbi:cytosolic 5'-nucleotidase 1A-like isoform X2 [Molothrus ater]|uniref:cytosolic 5'-nucleotidase 1A-like isoform X2 n=1 Tax=Molothrus ater TaxID=84834 RepID=UPI0023E79743|nr:cytosolic 5'-nucleotidase 1A-like isoform X2 [Molothrus ater]
MLLRDGPGRAGSRGSAQGELRVEDGRAGKHSHKHQCKTERPQHSTGRCCDHQSHLQPGGGAQALPGEGQGGVHKAPAGQPGQALATRHSLCLHPGLEISKFCFVSDEDSTQYLKSHGVKLFLSADRTDVCNALRRGVSAALVFQQEVQAPRTPLRVAFDGDAVLFSDETDRIFQEQGLEGALQYERAMEAVPIGEGPLKAFAMHLGKMRKKFGQGESPIRTYLVTARSGRDMGVRAIKTLREWGLPIDEAFFMDGAPKGPILAQIQPHIFFDDGLHNIQGAQNVGVPSAWVPSCC